MTGRTKRNSVLPANFAWKRKKAILWKEKTLGPWLVEKGGDVKSPIPDTKG